MIKIFATKPRIRNGFSKRIGISDHFLQLLHGYSIGWSGIKRDAVIPSASQGRLLLGVQNHLYEFLRELIHELVPHGTGSHTEFLNLFRSQIDNLDAGLDKAFTGLGLVFRVQLRTLIGQRFSGGFPDQPLSLRVQLVPHFLLAIMTCIP